MTSDASRSPDDVLTRRQTLQFGAAGLVVAGGAATGVWAFQDKAQSVSRIALNGPGVLGRPALHEDTVSVLPMQQMYVDVEADNPGQWLLHCHNLYHEELGMMTEMSYVR